MLNTFRKTRSIKEILEVLKKQSSILGHFEESVVLGEIIGLCNLATYCKMINAITSKEYHLICEYIDTNLIEKTKVFYGFNDDGMLVKTNIKDGNFAFDPFDHEIRRKWLDERIKIESEC